MEQVASIEDLAGFLMNGFFRSTLASTFCFVLQIRQKSGEIKSLRNLSSNSLIWRDHEIMTGKGRLTIEVQHRNTHFAENFLSRKVFSKADFAAPAAFAFCPHDVEPPARTDKRMFVNHDSDLCRKLLKGKDVWARRSKSQNLSWSLESRSACAR